MHHPPPRCTLTGATAERIAPHAYRIYSFHWHPRAIAAWASIRVRARTEHDARTALGAEHSAYLGLIALIAIYAADRPLPIHIDLMEPQP